MPAPIKFHLDEHIHPAIAIALHAQGIDVTSTVDARLDGAADTQQLASAETQGRVLVTHDHDFLRLHGLGVNHAGIAYCHQEKYTLRQHLHLLVLLYTCYSAEEMQRRVEYL
jgi:hypothetical protein